MRTRGWLALLALLALPGASRAASVAGVALPDTVSTGGQTLKLNGAGVRTVTMLEVKVYVAALYVAQPPMHDARSIETSPMPKVLVLHYLHEGSKAQIAEHYREGEHNNCASGGCAAADGPDFEKLIAMSPAVKVGDTTTYIFTPGGVSVLANGQPLVQFANPDLALRLLDGFIGAKPPSPALRAALLAQPR